MMLPAHASDLAPDLASTWHLTWPHLHAQSPDSPPTPTFASTPAGPTCATWRSAPSTHQGARWVGRAAACGGCRAGGGADGCLATGTIDPWVDLVGTPASPAIVELLQKTTPFWAETGYNHISSINGSLPHLIDCMDPPALHDPFVQDIDDALHVRPLPSGNYELGVHIADVTHFLHPGTAMDLEAAARWVGVGVGAAVAKAVAKCPLNACVRQIGRAHV